MRSLAWIAALAAPSLSGSGLPRDEPPRLVVLLCVDQLFSEQLDRLDAWLDGGLARIWREGTVHRAAMLSYAATETGPGHATLATGCRPARHGLVGNAYHDRVLGRGMYCVGDQGAQPVTSAGRGEGSSVSPANLLVPGLADRMRSVFPGSHCVSIAGKDRAAVSMGGRKGTVLWWDRRDGGFATSTFYGAELPPFASEWNAAWMERAGGWRWEADFPGDPALVGTHADDRPGEAPFGTQGWTFPYELPEGQEARSILAPAVFATPLIDEFTIELARSAVAAQGLGDDGEPDLLAIGLSGCDVVGHQYGPYSWEVTDLLLRVDDALAVLFDELDARVGAGNWIVALSSDHGVLELPEALAARDVGARRIDREESAAVGRAAREALESAYPGVDVGLAYDGRTFVLDPAAVQDAGLDGAEVRATLARAAESVPWVGAAYTLEDLAGDGAVDGWIGLYRAGFHPDRSEDVVLRAEPWLLGGMGRGTSHGSPYPYDRRIPLAFYGAGFEARRLHGPAASEDAVPTLLAVLGVAVEDGELDGRSLLE